MIILNMFLVAQKGENSENKNGSMGPATCARGRGGVTTVLAVPPPSPRPQVSPRVTLQNNFFLLKGLSHQIRNA
jgi:hypothetical protein